MFYEYSAIREQLRWKVSRAIYPVSTMQIDGARMLLLRRPGGGIRRWLAIRTVILGKT